MWKLTRLTQIRLDSARGFNVLVSGSSAYNHSSENEAVRARRADKARRRGTSSSPGIKNNIRKRLQLERKNKLKGMGASHQARPFHMAKIMMKNL